MAQWLARRIRDPAAAGPIPTTGHAVISSVHPSVKWVPGHRHLKCIYYKYYSNQRLTGCDTVVL